MKLWMTAAVAALAVTAAAYLGLRDAPAETPDAGVAVEEPAAASAPAIRATAAEPETLAGRRPLGAVTAAVGGPILSDEDAVAAAVREGFTVEQIDDPRFGANRARTAIGIAQYRFGPDSPEGQAAIDEANRVSVLLTNARAARRRLNR